MLNPLGGRFKLKSNPTTQVWFNQGHDTLTVNDKVLTKQVIDFPLDLANKDDNPTIKADFIQGGLALGIKKHDT